jgi:hypothetical protein
VEETRIAYIFKLEDQLGTDSWGGLSIDQRIVVIINWFLRKHCDGMQ